MKPLPLWTFKNEFYLQMRFHRFNGWLKAISAAGVDAATVHFITCGNIKNRKAGPTKTKIRTLACTKWQRQNSIYPPGLIKHLHTNAGSYIHTSCNIAF